MMTEFENEVASIVDPRGVYSLDDILKLVEEKFTSTNTCNPKLLDDMEEFAVACDSAGNGRDAREVRSWVKQLRVGA